MQSQSAKAEDEIVSLSWSHIGWVLFHFLRLSYHWQSDRDFTATKI